MIPTGYGLYGFLDHIRVLIRRIQDEQTPKLICLCGSSRFVDIVAVIKWEMEKAGIIALGMHLLPLWYPGVNDHHQAEAEGVAETLDALHLRKIDLCDVVFVVNPSDYIGDRTGAEIEYAMRIDKPVYFLVRSGWTPGTLGVSEDEARV